jgi:ADP-ribosyl-[dinitrogen reductase] hydrolase
MVAKTSESHPLRIDHVGMKGLKGRIGLTFCPGKKQANALTGTWDRNLDLDLDRIRDFGAKALVTLMEDSEFKKVMVPGKEFEAKSASRGIEWHNLPIRDVHVPDDSFETLWTYTGARLRRRKRPKLTVLTSEGEDRCPLIGFVDT